MPPRCWGPAGPTSRAREVWGLINLPECSQSPWTPPGWTPQVLPTDRARPPRLAARCGDRGRAIFKPRTGSCCPTGQETELQGQAVPEGAARSCPPGSGVRGAPPPPPAPAQTPQVSPQGSIPAPRPPPPGSGLASPGAQQPQDPPILPPHRELRPAGQQLPNFHPRHPTPSGTPLRSHRGAGRGLEPPQDPSTCGVGSVTQAGFGVPRGGEGGAPRRFPTVATGSARDGNGGSGI